MAFSLAPVVTNSLVFHHLPTIRIPTTITATAINTRMATPSQNLHYRNSRKNNVRIVLLSSSSSEDDILLSRNRIELNDDNNPNDDAHDRMRKLGFMSRKRIASIELKDGNVDDDYDDGDNGDTTYATTYADTYATITSDTIDEEDGSRERTANKSNSVEEDNVDSDSSVVNNMNSIRKLKQEVQSAKNRLDQKQQQQQQQYPPLEKNDAHGDTPHRDKGDSSANVVGMMDSIGRNTEIIQNDIDDASILDDYWVGALQEEEESSSSSSSSSSDSLDVADARRRSNKISQRSSRMRMFAYLSQPIVEVRIIGLVFVSCFLQAINTLDDAPPIVHRGINAIDDVFVYIFAVEFFLRWWSAGRFQFRYLAKPLASVDAVVVILPLLIGGLLPLWDLGILTGLIPPVSLPTWLLSFTTNSGSALLNLRLLRLLKFQRVLTDKNTYANFQMALGMRRIDNVRPYQLQIARTVTSIFTLVSVSTGLIYTAEHEVNPDLPDYFTALYFGLTTLTTVGFGDITPMTSQGRLVVGGTILAGVAIIPAQAASLAEAYLDYQKERSGLGGVIGGGGGKEKQQQQTIARAETEGGEAKCGSCGAGPHRKDAVFCWSCGEVL